MSLVKIIWMLRHLLRRFRKVPRIWYRELRGWLRFWESFDDYCRLAAPDTRPMLELLYPCLGDDTANTQIEPIYFYQDAWAFEKIVQQQPSRHVDIGSHHKFVALLSKVVPVTMIDLRPLSLSLNTLDFKEGSILDLPYDDKSISSISSLCVVEHIGLGRYGDPLDPRGSEKAIMELKRVLKFGGSLYISVPIDDENRVYFNAHRAFAEDYLNDLFDPLDIAEKRYIFGSEFRTLPKSGYGIGCYHLVRRVR